MLTVEDSCHFSGEGGYGVGFGRVLGYCCGNVGSFLGGWTAIGVVYIFLGERGLGSAGGRSLLLI